MHKMQAIVVKTNIKPNQPPHSYVEVEEEKKQE